LQAQTSLTTSDTNDLGNFLVVLLVLVFIAASAMVVLELQTIVHAIREASRSSGILQCLPQEDPPAGSDAFYNIQIPVTKANMGDNFKPMPPHELLEVDNETKLEVVRLLTMENEERLDNFFRKMHHRPLWMRSGLELVEATKGVDGYRKVHVKHSSKTVDSIVAKAQRPCLRSQHPHFGIEHVRDTFRFKAVVYSFRDALSFISCLHSNKHVSPKGLSPDNVVKLDIAKLTKPKVWGWRFIAFDFRM
jgi:hypothetical protein